MINPFAPADLGYFSMPDPKVVEQLQEIRQGVEEAFTLDSETEVFPESAYTKARFLLTLLQAFMPPPDIMWLENGMKFYKN